MYYIEVERGVKIYVNDLNPSGKKNIFLIHGWPVNYKMFEYQLDVLPKHGFRCISIDLRGFGNSDKPWEGYSYDRLADDVFMVIRSLNVNNLTLVGFSMGGPIAIRYMARHMGYKVTKLALLAAAAPSFTRRPGYPYGMSTEEVNALISKTYKDRPQMVSDFGKQFFASRITESFSNWFNSLGLSASGHATIKTAQSLRDEDMSSDLPKISVPTGIFHGKLDRICPFEFALEMHEGMKNSRIIPFEESGHAVFYDQLELFNSEFLEFLKL
ncbi:MAG: alpha/beta hydrolase [Eubacteriales bacterium]